MLALLPIEPPQVDALPLERSKHGMMEGRRVRVVERVEGCVARRRRQRQRGGKGRVSVLLGLKPRLEVQVQRVVDPAGVRLAEEGRRVREVLAIEGKPDQHGQLWLKSMLFSSSLPYVLRKHV